MPRRTPSPVDLAAQITAAVAEESTAAIYRIGKVKPSYASSFEFRSLTWWVHRPVAEDGTKQDAHWQISLDGIPMSLLTKATKEQAIGQFTRVIDKSVPDDAELRRLISRCKDDNRRLWRL